MDNLIGEVVYNKFLTEKVELKIEGVINLKNIKSNSQK